MEQLGMGEGEKVGNPFRGFRVFTKSEYAAFLKSPEGDAYISEQAGASRNEPWRGNRRGKFTGFYIVVCDPPTFRAAA